MHKKKYPGNDRYIVTETGVYNKYSGHKMKPCHNGKYNIQPAFSPVQLSIMFNELEDFEYAYDLDSWSIAESRDQQNYKQITSNYIAVFDDDGCLLRIFRTPSRRHLKMSTKLENGLRKNINRWKINNRVYTRKELEDDYNNNNN